MESWTTFRSGPVGKQSQRDPLALERTAIVTYLIAAARAV
jgi:hypothetical protein